METGSMQWSEELRRMLSEPDDASPSFERLIQAVSSKDRPRIRGLLDELRSGTRSAFDVEHGVEDPLRREERTVEHLAEVAELHDGRPRRLVGTVQDVTARRRTEARIRRLNQELEQRVAKRTSELEAANQELEAFAYTVSHDLRAPLRSIDGFSQALLEDCGEALGELGSRHLERIRVGAARMGELIDGMLGLSRVGRASLERVSTDLSELARGLVRELDAAVAPRRVTAVVSEGLRADCDPALMRAALQNLLGNAYKYTARNPAAEVEFGATDQAGARVFFVRDNGAGFDMEYADQLFVPFKRLHSDAEFPGTGVGLATVARIIHRHGGRIWAESHPGLGATFRFTLRPDPRPVSDPHR